MSKTEGKFVDMRERNSGNNGQSVFSVKCEAGSLAKKIKVCNGQISALLAQVLTTKLQEFC